MTEPTDKIPPALRKMLEACTSDELRTIRAIVSNMLIENRSGGRNGGRPRLPRCASCGEPIHEKTYHTNSDGKTRHLPQCC
jgi:hypothetical protein